MMSGLVAGTANCESSTSYRDPLIYLEESRAFEAMKSVIVQPTRRSLNIMPYLMTTTPVTDIVNEE